MKGKLRHDKNQLELFKAVGTHQLKSGEHFLVDGSNVMGVRGRNQPPSLKILLHLLVALKGNDCSFTCISDANARHILYRHAGQEDRDIYLQLLDQFSSCFTESTGGMRADDLLLQRADKLGQRIVSNDKFSVYENKFSWLRNPDARLIKFQVVNNDLQIPTLEIMVSCDGELKPLIHELESKLASNKRI